MKWILIIFPTLFLITIFIILSLLQPLQTDGYSHNDDVTLVTIELRNMGFANAKLIDVKANDRATDKIELGISQSVVVQAFPDNYPDRLGIRFVPITGAKIIPWKLPKPEDLNKRDSQYGVIIQSSSKVDEAVITYSYLWKKKSLYLNIPI